MYRAIEQHPLIKAYSSRASVWEKQTYDQWRRAAEDFEVLLRQDESREVSAGQAFCAGQAARKMEFYEQAARYFYKAAELLPDWALPLEGLAAAYLQLGRRSEAEDNLNRALKLDVSLIHARLCFAELFCERNNYQAAEGVIELGLKHHPADVGFYCFLGHIALSDKRFDVAERYYQRALKLEPECDEAYTGLSCIRMIQERYNDALDMIKLALGYNERATGALVNCGIIQSIFNQPAEAEATFDLAISLTPRLAKNYFRLATFYWKQKNVTRAERYLRLAINCESYRSHYHSALALLMLEQGRLDDAEQNYRQALLLNPEDILALHGLSVLAQMGQDRQASNELLVRATSLLKAGKRNLTSKLVARLHPKLKPETDGEKSRSDKQR